MHDDETISNGASWQGRRVFFSLSLVLECAQFAAALFIVGLELVTLVELSRPVRLSTCSGGDGGVHETGLAKLPKSQVAQVSAPAWCAGDESGV